MKEVKVAQHESKAVHLIQHKNGFYLYLVGTAPASFSTKKLVCKLDRDQATRLIDQLQKGLANMPTTS